MARSLKKPAKYRGQSDGTEYVVTLRMNGVEGTPMIGVRERGQRESKQHEVTFGQLHTILALRAAARKKPRRRLRGF
jgi:hypothetical protein